MRACRRRRWQSMPRRCRRCGARCSALELRQLAPLVLDRVLQVVHFLAYLRDLRYVGVALAMAQALARLLGDAAVLGADRVELLVFQFLEIEERIVSAFGEADELVELHLDRFRVAVLRALDQEHHEESDDGGAGVDDQLPGIAEAEERAAESPEDDDAHGAHEGRRPAGHLRGPLGKAGKPAFRTGRTHLARTVSNLNA